MHTFGRVEKAECLPPNRPQPIPNTEGCGPMSTPSGQRFWVGDLHLGHRLVTESPRLSDYDDLIMGQLMALRSADQMWLLGISPHRNSTSSGAFRSLAEVPAQLDLKAAATMLSPRFTAKGYKLQREYLEVFRSVQQLGRIRVQGEQVLMSHYPYVRAGDGPDRPGCCSRHFQDGPTARACRTPSSPADILTVRRAALPAVRLVG